MLEIKYKKVFPVIIIYNYYLYIIIIITLKCSNIEINNILN